jgi:hypothetical protein
MGEGMSETIFLFTSSADVLGTIHELQTWLDAGRVPRPRGEAAWTDAKGRIDRLSAVAAWCLGRPEASIAAIGRELRNLADTLRAAGPASVFWSGSLSGLGEDLPWKNACTRAERELETLRNLLGTPPAAPVPPAMPTIWHHGGRSYSTDGIPLQVSNEQHNVLSAFVDRDEAVDTKTLTQNGVSNVAAVIDKLAEKFGHDAIRRPAAKGDGYFIRVRTFKSN